MANDDSGYITWKDGVQAFREHIVDRLVKEGSTFNDAVKLIHENEDKHHPKIKAIMDDVIAKAPGGKGVSCTIAGRKRFLILGVEESPKN